VVKLLHRLFPSLHSYHKSVTNLVLLDGVIMPVKQAVCACGDKQPLGSVDLHKPEIYDPTAGMVDTPAGLAKYVAFDPVRQIVTVEQDFTHLVDYPADRCFVSLEGCH
jgi:hypothetical protein